MKTKALNGTNFKHVALTVILISALCGVLNVIMLELEESETLSAISNTIRHIGELFTLAPTFICFGHAFFFSRGKSAKVGLVYMLLPLLGTIVQSFVSTAIVCFDLTKSGVLSRISESAFYLMFGLFSLAVTYYAIFLASYFVILRKDKKAFTSVPFFSISTSFTVANLIAVGVTLVHKLIAKIIDTADFVSSHAPLYKGETISIIIDFVMILISVSLAYLILWLCESRLAERTKRV